MNENLCRDDDDVYMMMMMMTPAVKRGMALMNTKAAARRALERIEERGKEDC